jgi:RimJ/RimL family protein N-acetyltransferase
MNSCRCVGQCQFNGFFLGKGDTMPIRIRALKESDAHGFLALSKKIMSETPFMLRLPQEITMSVAQQAEQIRVVSERGVHLILVAEDEENSALVGYLAGIRGELTRNKHKLALVVGVLQAETGKGIGTQLFAKMLAWAREHDILRVDLTVMTNNHIAIAFYSKEGFSIEGMKQQSLCVNGQYVDEYLMAKLLG